MKLKDESKFYLAKRLPIIEHSLVKVCRHMLVAYVLQIVDSGGKNNRRKTPFPEEKQIFRLK